MFIFVLLSLGVVTSGIVYVWKFKNRNEDKTITNGSNFSYSQITPDIALLKNKEIDTKSNYQQKKRLVLLFCWMYSKRKDIQKYADIWLQKGFDVLTIRVTPWKCLWPIIGVQAVATDVLKFLDNHWSYSEILVHGMSIGGYAWSETMVKMTQDIKKYQHILDKIKGQIWDSLAYPDRIPEDLPVVMFPSNNILSTALKQYLLFHLNTFYEWSAKQHVAGLRVFEQNLVRTPALMLLSDTDMLGRLSNNLKTIECWEKLGMTVFLKIFQDSPHVGHLRKYPEEYKAQLEMYLNHINLKEDTQNHEKLERVNKNNPDSRL